MAKKYHVYKNHTLEEYNKKYENRNYKVVDKVDADKTPELLDNKSWWLINDKYYEVPNKKGVAACWSNMGTAGRIITCALCAGVVAAAIAVPIAVTSSQGQPTEPSITVTGATVDKEHSSVALNKDSTVAFTYSDKKEFVKLNYVKVGDKEVSSDLYTLVDGNTQSKKVNIKAAAMTSVKVEISVQLKDKETDIKVTSVTITNTVYEVDVNNEIELTASVLPENATNKKLNWKVTDGTGSGVITIEDGKTYLKGISIGTVTVTAIATDGSGKSDGKQFRVGEYTFLDFVQVGETDTCLVKMKVGHTLPKDLTIPEKDPNTDRIVVGIGMDGFGIDAEIETIAFENSENITTISNRAFYNNKTLTSFAVPKNVTEIGDQAFQFNGSHGTVERALTTITFDSNSKLKKIGANAFSYQWKLASISIPASVEYIGPYAFNGDSGLATAIFEDNSSLWLYSKGSIDNVFIPSNPEANAKMLQDADFSLIKSTVDIKGGESPVIVGKTAQLDLPAGTKASRWASCNATIATVSDDGKVTAVAEGETYVYVKTTDDAIGIKKIVVEGIPTYNIDWSSLYNTYATSAKEIHFSKSESTDGTLCGETKNDKVYCSYKDKILNIWAKEKIVFSDNDASSEGSTFFHDLQYLEAVTLENIDTSKVTSMKSMFYNCRSLKSIDLSSVDTSSVTNMNIMFGACTSLSSIVFPKDLDTSKVTSMYGMFASCFELETIDLSLLNTSSVTDMTEMFAHDAKLSSLDLTSFDTSKVESMKMMFYNCFELKNINLSSFKTSKVTNMFQMFVNCTYLTSLDLSTFDTANVKNMTEMFNVYTTSYVSALKTIYVSDKFVTSGLDEGCGSKMFNNCVSLIGGAGTTYDSKKVDATYARIDGGVSKPGYFTKKAEEKTANLVLDSSFSEKLQKEGWINVGILENTISESRPYINFTYDKAGDEYNSLVGLFTEDGTCVQTTYVVFSQGTEQSFEFENFDKITSGCTLTIKEAKTVSVNYVCAYESEDLSIEQTGRTASIVQGKDDINFIVKNTGTETIIPTIEVYAADNVVYVGGGTFAPNSSTPTSIINSDIHWEEVEDGSTITVWIS